MLKAVSCASCGAKVREDRARCLRCGAPITAAGAAPAAARPRAASANRLLSWPALGIAAVLAAAGFAHVLTQRDSALGAVSHAEPATGGPAAPAGAPASSAPDAEPAHVGLAPPPVMAAMDMSRAGVAAYNRGDFAASFEEFTAAVDADPRNAVALNNLGQLLARAGRVREAIAYFDRAIAVSGSTWAFHFNRARALAELREWAPAVAGYRDAAGLFPDDYATHYNLAKALQAHGDLPAAIREFERAIELAPGQADFHLSHGLALEAAGRPQDAVAAYRDFLELEPDAADADKVRARIAALGRPAATSVTP